MRMRVGGRPVEALIGPVVVAVAAVRAIRETWAQPVTRTAAVPLPGVPPPAVPARPGPRSEVRPAPAAARREKSLRGYLTMFTDAFARWQEHEAPTRGAALSYYAIFSLAPMLVIAIAVAGLAFGAEAARGQIVGQIEGLVGRRGAELVQTMLRSTQKPGQGVVAFVGGTLALLLGATGVFLQLQNALDKVWELRREKRAGIWAVIADRLRAFGLVLGVGFLLLVSLVVSAALSGFGDALDRMLGVPGPVLEAINFAVSIGVLTLLFALMYRFVPDARIPWRDVWPGALVTAVLFTIGKFLIGLYLGQSSTASAYGAAGSLVILLVWIYYSAQILLYGAEVTRIYAERHGSGVRPDREAVAVA